MEQVLYAELVMLRRKGLKPISENKNKNEAKFKFQGQSARSQRWFHLDFDWIKIFLAYLILISIIKISKP